MRVSGALWLAGAVDHTRLLERLDAEFARLRMVASRDLVAPVPTCPGWRVEDLVRHLANGYLNVVVRRLRMPEDVPRQNLSGEDALAAVDRGYASMRALFAARDPGEQVGRTPAETVFFWIRRMTHETAIHRIDVEVALGETVVPIPPDVAVDGIDELLADFLAYETREFTDEHKANLSDWAGRPVLVSAGTDGWRVTLRPDGADVTTAEPEGDAAAAIRGHPSDLLAWLYNREVGEEVAVTGEAAMVAQLRRLVTSVMNTG
jgi:uncharacterized protein (TIGR03083 family)